MSGLYLHVPFCRRKCPYCDFFSIPAADDPALRAYPELLCRHMEVARRNGWSGPLETVFFGGGTPSLLTPREIGWILERAHALFGLTPEAEISLEANPGTVSRASLEGYRAAGVNRLSLGVQSLDAGHLRTLGRIHSPDDARRAVEWARKAGFENLSCDLMFGLPAQDLAGLEAEIEAFLSLHPDHLSCYSLTIEEETPFHHQHRAGGLALPDEETGAALFRALHEQLGEAGFLHYEISNYGRPGRECRHNQRYWQRLGTLGVGAGAHTFAECGWGVRCAAPTDLQAFSAALDRGEDPSETLETFDRRGAMAETLYLGLRTAEGVDEKSFRERFGTGIEEAFPEAVRRAGERLRREREHWHFDLEGWLLYNHLITPFL